MNHEQHKDDKERKGLSRRSFLKSTGIGVASAAAGVGLIGAQPAAAQDMPTAMNAELAGQKWSFEIPPDPIPDSEIANTVEAEIIIVGSGTSGLVCANSAVENGANVVLISASSGPISRGGSNHAIKSKVLDSAGVEPYDVAEFFKQELSSASYNVDQDKWWRFANHCEEAMNWVIDKMDAAGYQAVLEMDNFDEGNGVMKQPIGSHSWIGGEITASGAGQQLVVETLAQTAMDAGVQILYKTVAKQLVRADNNTGRVSAVIAQAEDGSYTKYVGTKAIVLATGDFSADREMMAKYCPAALPLLDDTGDQGYDTSLKIGGLYPGDGQKMGLWVGAAWQKTFPNAPMILVGEGGAGLPSTQPNGAHRGLLMNNRGLRYGNEDNNGSTAALSMMHQPGRTAFAIWGTNYAEDRAPWYQFGQIYGDDPIPPSEMIEKWELMARIGQFVKGDTIEEVIEKLGLPAEATKATVDRYNELCANGVDEDFHKRAELLVPIAEAPFYGGSYARPTFLTVMGGLRTDINCQVCDENDEPIPGLFNVGTMIGDVFANTYNFMIPGHNLGANCITNGYLTGRYIATEAV